MGPDISTLVQKSDYDTKLQKLKTNMLVIPDLTQKKKKNYKHLIRAFLEVKVILKKVVYKIIYYFNQYADILK